MHEPNSIGAEHATNSEIPQNQTASKYLQDNSNYSIWLYTNTSRRSCDTSIFVPTNRLHFSSFQN